MKTEEVVASEGCGVCAYGNLQVFRAKMRAILVPFISNLVQLFDMEMVEVTAQLILKALSSSLSISLGRVKEMGILGLKKEKRKYKSRKCVYCAHVCARERERERETAREKVMERERDLVCQGCCVSNVVVEPLQCTKTKGREGVRVRRWVERERERKIERGEEREGVKNIERG